MKNQWLAYVIVALLSIGAGAAIAGLPTDDTVDATIVLPATTSDGPTTTDAATTTEPDTTTPDTTEPDTTEPERSTTATTTTVPDAPATTSTSTAVPNDDLPDRSEFFTIVANGANISGAAGRAVERLQAIGYADAAPRNGTVVFEFTTVYFADGFDDAAFRLADDLELLAQFVAPLSEAPEVLQLPDGTELLVYLGLDRAI